MAHPYSNRLDVVSRGSLDDITRPAGHGTCPPGSRAADSAVLNAHRESVLTSGGRRSIPNPSALEMLPAENISPEGFDIDVDEYGLDQSDYTSGESDFEELNLVPDPVEVARERQAIRERRALQEQQMDNEKPDELEAAHAMLDLVKFEDDDDDDDQLLDDESSDEEPAIVRELKGQITDQVRQEMSSELEVYQMRRNRLKQEDEKAEADDAEFEGMDPKLKEAILKMRKYDRILKKKMKKERQVKRDRIMLQKRLREELDNIKPEGRTEQREVELNMKKFLALGPPPASSQNDGLDVESPPVTPVFQTQFIDPDADDKEGSTGTASQADLAAGGEQPDGKTNQKTKNKNRSNKTDDHSNKDKKKDYIKRNIELAADAANMIAMTDDEKKRVEDLLADLDALQDTELPEQEESNPYQIVLTSGEGYRPTEDELKRLEVIDERLRAILPIDDYMSVASTTPRGHPSQQSFRLFPHIDLESSLDVDQPGEPVLQDTREGRSLQQRLHMIEQELAHLTNAVDLEIESPTLSEAQLNDLLEQCSRTMSRATEETNSLAGTNPLTPGSGRSSYMGMVQPLHEDVLQKLLAEARKEMNLEEAPEEDSPDDLGATPTPSKNEQRRDILGVEEHSTTQHNDRDLLVESVTDDDLRQSVRPSSSASSRLGSAQRQFYYSLNGHSNRVSRPNSCRENQDTACGVENLRPFSRDEPQERRPFLPEISTNVSLSTQPALTNMRLNNEPSYMNRCSSGRSNVSRTSALSIRNSLSETDVQVSYSLGGAVTTPSPHPPVE